MRLLIVAAAAAVGVAVLFVWLNHLTAKEHAGFQAKDVEIALSELVSPDSENHDRWDLFLAWPIDDPYLESVRQRCRRIVEEHPRRHRGEDISEEGQRQVAAILEELRTRGR